MNASYFLAAITGVFLFLIGSYGVMGVPLKPNRFLTVLLEPLGYSDKADRYYYLFLSGLGFWLCLGVLQRVSAAIALAMVLGKVAIVGGSLRVGIILPLGLAVSLYLVLYKLITDKRAFDDHSEDGNS